MRTPEFNWIPWVVTTVIAISVFALVLSVRHELRRREGRGRVCAAFGYDLRASPELCPECGMPVAGELIRIPLRDQAFNREWPANRIAPRKPAPGERLAFVHAAASARQAEVLANQFRARGIWCEVRPGPDETALLLVPALDAPMAGAIIARFAAVPLASPPHDPLNPNQA